MQPLVEVLERCVAHPDTASEQEAQPVLLRAVLVAQVAGDARVSTGDSMALVVRGCLGTLSGDVSTQDGAASVARAAGSVSPSASACHAADADAR